MRVLTSEESFHMMEAKFGQLKKNDLIDLCYEDQRYAALIISVDKPKRQFSAYKIDAVAVECIASGRPLPEVCGIVIVVLPPSPCNRHPQWNFVAK